MLVPILGSIALGLVKGLTSDGPALTPNLKTDLWGPINEELLYRGPLWLFPKLPYGSTAVLFAADHLLDDARAVAVDGDVPTAWEVVARFGDVFLGGWAYEVAMRESGILAAIAAHLGHNNALSIGTRLRSKK